MNLTSEQKEVVALDKSGHWLVKGAAGTGKTTVAIERAAFLTSQQGFFEGSDCIILCYNNVAIQYISNEISSNKNAKSSTFHSWAMGIINQALKGEYRNMGDDVKSQLIEEAIKKYKNENNDSTVLERPFEQIRNEIDFIQQHGITNVGDYRSVRRRGLGIKLDKSAREIIWKVYREFCQLRNRKNFQSDYESVALYLYHLYQSENPPDYKVEYVVVDECQDFSPMMLKAIACTTNNIMLLGDAAQQIYGKEGVSWKSAGINVAGRRSKELKRNFRNCLAIYNFAQSIKESPYWFDEGENIPVSSVPAVPRNLPIDPGVSIEAFDNNRKEADGIIFSIKESMKVSLSICLLLQKNREVDYYASELRKNGIDCSVLKKRGGFPDIRKGVFLTTVHSAKGLEFDIVYIPNYERNWGLISFDGEDYLLQDSENSEHLETALKLLYTGVTRARYRVYLTTYRAISLTFPCHSDRYLISPGRTVEKIEELRCFMNLKANKLKQEVITEISNRQIENLIHFTSVENLEMVLQNGLTEKDELHRREVSFDKNDQLRLEGSGKVCATIEYPNIKLLSKYRHLKGRNNYAIILINPEAAAQEDVDFYYANAATRKGETKCSFGEMFSDQSARLPLDNQAEIQMKEIPRNYIKEIHVVPGVHLSSRIVELSEHYDIPVVESAKYFITTLDDYIREQSENG